MPATLDPSSLCRVRCRQPPGVYAGPRGRKERAGVALGGHASVAKAASISRLAPPGDEHAVKGSRLKRAPTTIWLVP